MLKFPILQSEKCFRNYSSRNRRLKATCDCYSRVCIRYSKKCNCTNSL